MSTPGGGFQFGEDYVAARISIDVPTEGLASLRELSQEIERFRTNTESASRTADNFAQYLKASAEAAEHAASAQQGLVAQLQQMAEVQQRIASGSATSGGIGVPQGHVDPFASSPTGKGGAAPQTTPSADQQVEALRARDPRAYLNQQSAIGNVRPGDITGGSPAEIAQATERVAAREQAITQHHQENPGALPTPRGGAGMLNQATGLAQAAMGAMSPGGSTQGILNAGASMAGALGSSEAAGGLMGALGMGGLAKFAGPVGMSLAAVAAGYGLTQFGGEEIQKYANMGSVRGGGAMQGMGYEMSIRAQPLTSLVLTPDGWIKMGEITPGTTVIAGDGTATTVLGIYDHGVRDVYEVTFEDGGTTRCTLDHLWKVYTRGHEPRVMRFEDMLFGKRRNERGLRKKDGRPRYGVPLPGPIQFPAKDLPIDPYTLGLLLGDGSFGHGFVEITCFESEIFEMVLPEGCSVIERTSPAAMGRGKFYFRGLGRGIPNPLVSALKELGLMNKTTKDKFIPDVYLQGSVEQRFSLLQGLIDTDGSIGSTDGRVAFTNTSRQLIEGVRALVLSLGGKCYTSTRSGYWSSPRGSRVWSGESFRLGICLPSDLGPPARLPRKAANYRRNTLKTRQSSTRKIVSAEMVTKEECRCIYVEHPGHLYVTDDFIVTHNTMAMDPFLTNEQSRQIIQSALSEGYTGQTFDTVTKFIAPQPLSSPVLTPAGWRKMGELAVGDLVIGADGLPRPILGIQDWGAQEVFELKFHDGTSARSSIDHRWLVYCTTRSCGPKVKTLRDIMEKPITFNTGKGPQPRHRVPLAAPVTFLPETTLPLDPYLLGLLLGDGSFSCSIGRGQIKLAACIKEDEYEFNLPDGVIATRIVKLNDPTRYQSSYHFGVSQGVKINPRGRTVNPMKVILQDLGLLGLTTPDKFIPEQYLFASVQDRVALLQGLIDTDGCISRDGKVSFSNTSPLLIQGVTELVRSLGGMATVSWKTPKPGHPWGSRAPIAQIGIRFPPGIIPARLPRKAERYRPSLTTDRRASKAIVSIESVGYEACRCISVSEEGPDGLYVTEGYTVTHNSNLKDMNLSVGDSVKLLRTNVNEGGQSIAGLASSMALLKEASKTGATSLPELQASYASGTEAMIRGGGLSGPQASQAMLTLNNVWKDDQTLKLKAGEIVSGLSTSPQGQMAAMTLSGTPIPAGALPGTLFERMPDGGQAATFGMLKRIAQMAQQGSRGDEANGANLFQMYMARFANVQLDRAEARKMYLDLLSGKNPLEEGKREAQKAVENATRPQWRSPLEVMGGTLYDVGKQITDIPRSEFNLATSILGGKGWDDVKRRFGDVETALSGQDMVTGKGNARHIPMMDRIVDAYGTGGIEILDEKGRAIAFNQTNNAQLQALSQGKYTWRPKGAEGPGTKLSDTPMQGNIKEQMAAGGGQSVNVAGSVTLDLTPEARRALTPQGGTNVIQLTPHERQSNAGYGNARPNNAAPGETAMTRGRSGW